MQKADMCLFRSFWDLEFPCPTLPNFEFVGGLHCKPAKVLTKVIWRFEGKKPDTLGANTRLLKWITQNDLLGHSKTTAFVTHGGANRVFEAIYHGIPMVGIPLFVEQHDNIAYMEAKGAAIKLDFHTISTADLLNALKKIINKPS
ncbi:UDP-glucuronosyltransferase 2B13-like isoform X2 [Cavia porcellus]|uniref:UDP-glucuronosyltransferase 2B13-like isoform X2 n=1 Tax=Cavia porcellus TaxID=10141 RepID=UPI002FDFB81F